MCVCVCVCVCVEVISERKSDNIANKLITR